MAHPLQDQVTVQFSVHITSTKSQKSLMVTAVASLCPTQVQHLILLGGRVSLALSQLAFGTAAMDMLLAVWFR